MNLADFDYELPKSFIAQTPVEPRDASRLLVLNRQTGEIWHRRFSEIGEFLRAGDVLVFNDTRVIPARLAARKAGGGQVEVLLLRRRAPLTWEVLVGGKNIHPGAVLHIEGESGLQAVILEELDGPRRVVQFSKPITPLLDRVGHTPLPPYIHTPLADPNRYQTVYATVPGSAAAPTAGLHFTPELIKRLEEQGVIGAFITLHVGLDTFRPVGETRIEDHQMHGEWYEVNEAAARTISQAKLEGRRVIAVGTTAVRALESAAARGSEHRPVPPGSDITRLYIYPGYQFRVVDAMITNFHLPKSTLLMLVSAFAGRERILATYEVAKREGYRFYSFGDAMLII
ncbi:MAG: tRNA preQ1(34) S-adenosylmethionine ribosyltransferase-isomerase QueA [Anaerolineales bacterium]|nr:tRNA preQ1(34) S-adenosylmethionine ribosyltransferase-isomerase QueA [Anaerolineales bacterium]